jgi:hypothetical protein
LIKAAVMGVPHRKERDVERPGRESTETTQVSFGSVYDSQVRSAEFSFAELSLAELQFRRTMWRAGDLVHPKITAN